MKILVSFLVVFSLYSYATSNISTNMDKKVYYDADRTVQDEFEVLSEELDLFINDEASEELISLYKNGKLKDGEVDIEVDTQSTTESNTTTKVQPQDEQPGFFAKMLEKIGIGSTKKLATQEVVSSDEINSTVEMTQPEATNEDNQTQTETSTNNISEQTSTQDMNETIAQEPDDSQDKVDNAQMQDEVTSDEAVEEKVTTQDTQQIQNQTDQELSTSEQTQEENANIEDEVVQPNEIVEEEVPNEN